MNDNGSFTAVFTYQMGDNRAENLPRPFVCAYLKTVSGIFILRLRFLVMSKSNQTDKSQNRPY